MSDEIDPQKLALTSSISMQNINSKKPPRHKPGERFLKGPIPLKWLSKAARLPGKAFHCSIAIYVLAGIREARIFPLERTVINELGINRHSVYRGLSALEKHKLINVERHPGRFPIVTILEAE
ncbi:MAG: hypothetical protein JSS07_06920 [Proteobacteria bacterium]|nr:hypothetical protein [Pseudomonadota bacterium]